MNWIPIVEEILGAYEKYLSDKHGSQELKRFTDRYKNNEEAAISEAIIFNWLNYCKFNPELADDMSTGGADFICSPNQKSRFVVEVTCLGRQALTEATGLHMIPGQHSKPVA